MQTFDAHSVTKWDGQIKNLLIFCVFRKSVKIDRTVRFYLCDHNLSNKNQCR